MYGIARSVVVALRSNQQVIHMLWRSLRQHDSAQHALIVKKRIHPGYIIVILVGFILAGACAPYYVPGRVPTPQFDKTRDTYVAAGYGAGGYQAEVGVAPAGNLWLSGHFSYFPFMDSLEVLADRALSIPQFLGQVYGEFGVGWYTIADDGQFALLGGYGRGRTSLVESKNFNDTTQPYWALGGGAFETYFLQVSTASLDKGSNAYGGLVLRSEYMRFRDFVSGGSEAPEPSALLIGPRVYAGASLDVIPDLRFEMQLGFQIRIAGNEQFRFQPFHISIMCIGLLDLF
jgi:hypothetical protein